MVRFCTCWPSIDVSANGATNGGDQGLGLELARLVFGQGVEGVSRFVEGLGMANAILACFPRFMAPVLAS